MGQTGHKHLPFDEHFFDRERKTPDQLKVLWYIAGVSAGSYGTHRPNRRGDTCNVWSSKYRELVAIVKRCLKSEHALSYSDTGRIRYWKLQIVNEDLTIQLSTEYGLGENRNQHELPEDLPISYFDHYLRGLYDSVGKCRVYANQPVKNGKKTIYHGRVDLRIRLSEALRDGMYHILLRKANIPPAIGSYNTSPSHLIFTGDAIHRIADYMYHDWEFIESNGLYVRDKLDDIVNRAGFPRPGRTERLVRAS